MSKSRDDLSRRSKALSTNSRGFVSSKTRFDAARENLNDEDDEDVRLETYRRTKKVDAMRSIAGHESRGLKSQDILEESPNGYIISGKAPPEMPRAIKYYAYQLRQYTVTDYPVEYGICHYNLGKIFIADKHHTTRDFEARAKSIENGLHHFRLAVEVFDYDSYPIMYAIINIFIGQLFRERAMLITARSVLAKRGVTVADSCTIGLSQLMDAAMTFSNAGSHVVENAICHVEIGWLYLLQITEAMTEEGLVDPGARRKGRQKKEAATEEQLMTLREHAITSLEKAEGLLESLRGEPVQTRYGPKKMARGWDPLERDTYPAYINLLIMDLSLEYIYGLIAYLTGRIYQDWDPGLEHQSQAYEFYRNSVKANGLPVNCNEYIDAHHRIAQVLVQNPAIYDDDMKLHEDGMPTSDLCYVVASEHLHHALQSPVIKPGRKMDIAFHLAQANIARFHIIVDRVKPPQSVVQALVERDGIDIMKDIEKALREAMKGATAANTQSTQDAFVYFYSSIKLSEFRTLQSGMDPALPAASRLKLLTQAFNLLVDALLSRSIVDNLDLHYIATLTMAQGLMASRCFDPCTMWYTKALMCLSSACNRTQHTPKGIKQVCFHKVETEMQMQVEKSIMASSRELRWEKEHLGALYLTESVTSGYAYWSFEEEYNKPPKPPPEPPKKAPTAAEAMEGRHPPEMLQPYMSDSEREYANRQRLTGDAMRDSDMSTAPIGAVPLWAMHHKPEFEKLDEILKAGKFGHRENNQFSERQRATVPGDINQTLMMHVHIVKSQEHIKKNVSLMPKVAMGRKAKKLQPRVERPQLTKIGETKKVRKPGLYGLLTGEMEEVPADMAPGQHNSNNDEAVAAIPKIDLMASRQCFCFFMTLSRLSRSSLILRANSVRFNYGRRARDILSSLQASTGRAYFDINRQLGKASEHLVVPPTSIRELSRRTFEDLKGVFRSNVEICRLLADYEEFLYTKLARFDYHIPMICAMPSLTRDICGSDAMLLNPDVMLDSMVEEARRQAQEEAEAEMGDGVDAGVYVRDKESPTKDKWRLSSPTKSKKPQLDAGAKARVAAAKKKAKKDALDHMAYNLFQKLDGSGFLGGSKHMLSEKLNPNEVMLLWHYPSMDDQKVHLIMVWREESHNYVYRARRRETFKKLKKEGVIDPELPNFIHLKDVVMEVCRSEVTRAQLDTLIRNYLKALNQNSAARRITHSTKALRALSSYLSIGETLLMLPRHIDSIVVCCPTFMRAIPWHALLIEIHTEEFGQGASSTAELVAKGKLPKSVAAFQAEADILENGKEENVPGVEEWHLIEKYMVRMGPSLALFEVCLVLSDELGSAHGTHRMCAIDGEARSLRSPGLRATDCEVACVTATFSGDPDDVTLLQYDLASARQVDTGKATHVSKAELKRRNQVRELKASKRDAKMAEYEKDDDMGVDDMGSESDSDMSSDDEEAIGNRNALSMARVLHFAANRMPMQVEVDGNPAAMAAKGHHGVNFGDHAAVCLPQYVNRHGDVTQDRRRELSAPDLVAQVNLRNCALAVMSRFGVCDGALSGSGVVDANVEYLESMHMIGAATVMYPMQNTGDQGGLNTLASTLFLVKFYVELPAHSRERLSVCKAHRNAMLWLRDQTATELISWLDSVPIPSSQREDLILEIEKYVDAATSGQDYGDTEDLPTVHEDEERVRPADRKFFAHFLLWGNYTVSGAGGNVHPKDLTEEGEDVTKDHLMYDNALNDIRMEIFMLKEERRFAEAKQLEKRLGELQLAAIQEKVDKAKYYGTLAARGMSDVLDALDKALLDQDDDEIDLEKEAPPPDEELQRQKVDKSYYVPKERKEATIDLWERGEVPTAAPRYVPLPDSLAQVGLDKLAETPTPISMMTAYVESLFPHGNKDAEDAFNKSKVKKLRVIKKQEEVERREMAMKMADNPDEYEGEIRDKERKEKMSQRKKDYEPMYEDIEAKKEEKQRLHKINHSADNAIDHLNSEGNSSACAIS